MQKELDSFNTAHEKEPSEESDDQHASSAREEVQIDKVTTTSSDPAPPKPPSAPLETAPSESHRSATPNPSKDNSEPDEKVQEDAQTEGVVSLGSSSDEISEKQGRKKRVMKILGLGTSKRLKTSKSEAPRQSSLDQPNAASGSQAITQNASVSSRVRSRKASERGTAVEVSPVTKRIDQFLRRKIIVERLSRMPPPVPSPSISPTSSNMTALRRFVAHDLGSVSIPLGLLTQEDLQAVLQKTTRALQALTGIVQDLSRSVAGSIEEEAIDLRDKEDWLIR
ncbi:hypothetical protein HID58_056819 [Brassica napus]|uniref:Uncharacterized protein n=1 Tax=Brassica napus TaxID=3708 RepID=A0ABQ8APA0_BRANA|nr:hypothetical protein HID58_056819 [Brassica napus]